MHSTSHASDHMISCNCVSSGGYLLLAFFEFQSFGVSLLSGYQKLIIDFLLSLRNIASFGSTARLEKRTYVTHARSFHWSLYSFCPLNLTLCDLIFFFSACFWQNKNWRMQSKQKDNGIWAYWTAGLKGTLSPPPQSALRKHI